MSWIKDLYIEELKKYGLKIKDCGLISFEQQLATDFEKILGDLTERIIDKRLKFQIFWIDHYSINASVIKIEDTYCIGLYTGITSSLIDHVNVFYKDGIKDVEGLEVPQIDIYYDVTKDNTNRGKIANYIYTLALLYIVMHEFGHVLCGHCEDLADTWLFEEAKNSEGNYFKQAKEYVADFYGIANSYCFYLPSCLKNIEDIGLITTLYITAIHTVFWIFANSKKSIHEIDCSKCTHPHPVVRTSYALEMIQGELEHMLSIFEKHQQIIIKDKKATEKIIDAAIEDFFNIISRTNIDFNISDILSPSCQNEIAKIMNELRNVREKYKSKAYIDFTV